MKRRLQILALCLTALLAAHLMAQDTGGGGEGSGSSSGGAGDTGGATSPDNSGATTSPDNSGGTTNPDNSGGSTSNGGENTNGGTTNGTSTTNGGTGTGTGTEGGTGTGTTPGTGTEGTGGASTITPVPPTLFPPGTAAPIPGMTPSPATPSPSPLGPNTSNPVAAGAAQAAPVTFTLPAGYGGTSAPQSFTLGQGRLAKPPITFSASVSEGYDNNIFSADAHLAPTPRPKSTPALFQEEIVGFTYNDLLQVVPILERFQVKPSPTPTPSPTPRPLGVIGSAVTTVNVGTQVQVGSPRTVVTMDLSGGEQYYWNQPGGKADYTGNFDLALSHKLNPHATVSIEAFAVYQNTPNFALVNAPTAASSNSSYMNGNLKMDLSYQWSGRLSTVSSYNLGFNILQTTAADNLYSNSFGTQFRYTVSPRNTVTAELRESVNTYPSNSNANTTSTFYLLGLDTFFSSKLRNSFSVGVESDSFASNGGSSVSPYFEGDTTLALPRGASLTWTNSYGFQDSPSAGQAVTSYRTGLSYSQPLSAKLVASLSIAYNNLHAPTVTAAAGYTQNQFQVSASLGYTLSQRLSLSLSYNYLDLLSSQVDSSYQRDQIYLGGSYIFR
jgi:hypothetical protein